MSFFDKIKALFISKDEFLDEDDVDVRTPEWQFNELLKVLVALSSPLEVQQGFSGPVAPRDNLVLDFETYYTKNRSFFIENSCIDKMAVEALDTLDNFLDEISGEDNEEFWYSVDPHPDWDRVGDLAKSALKVMGKDNLMLHITSSASISDNGLSVFQVKSELVDSKSED